MKKSVLIILFASLLFSNADATPIQWDVASGGNGHYYELIDSGQITWSAANGSAEKMTFQGSQGHLATITSNEENLFLSEFSFHGRVWLGGKYENEWSWVTGEEWDYTRWLPSYIVPYDSQNYPYLYKYFNPSSPYWANNHESYDLVGGFIVEYDASPTPTPEPSTMILFGMGCLGLAKVFRKKVN
ncbi:MAG: PEP-CTERM sorting domain-containing protein [Desulfobacterales bacterium]|nr:PEP-CTERM sorting domain-containing protein [Desulfobacterales bacterium]